MEEPQRNEALFFDSTCARQKSATELSTCFLFLHGQWVKLAIIKLGNRKKACRWKHSVTLELQTAVLKVNGEAPGWEERSWVPAFLLQKQTSFNSGPGGCS